MHTLGYNVTWQSYEIMVVWRVYYLPMDVKFVRYCYHLYYSRNHSMLDTSLDYCWFLLESIWDTRESSSNNNRRTTRRRVGRATIGNLTITMFNNKRLHQDMQQLSTGNGCYHHTSLSLIHNIENNRLQLIKDVWILNCWCDNIVFSIGYLSHCLS